MSPFWPTKPSSVLPSRVWPSDDGGWIISALESFDDGKRHHSLWSLSADGQAVRLGCDAKDQLFLVEQARPAITPDAVYIIVDSNPYGTWRIVKTPRR